MQLQTVGAERVNSIEINQETAVNPKKVIREQFLKQYKRMVYVECPFSAGDIAVNIIGFHILNV